MSIKGQSFSGGTDGALVNFDVGNAGNVFTGAFTIVALMKTSALNRGIFGGYSDTVGSTMEGGLFIVDNSGGRLYSISDFSDGFPDPGDLASPGLADDVWRWVAVSKAAGPDHYRMHYADLATLTWVHGEAVTANDHDDRAAVVVLSTYAIYPLGNENGDVAVIAAFDDELTDGDLEDALTLALGDLLGAGPVWGVEFKEATADDPVVDFTGGGGDEIARSNVAPSADPPDFDFTVEFGATVDADTIVTSAALPSAAASGSATVAPAAIVTTAALPPAVESAGSTVSPAVVAVAVTTPAAGPRTGSTVSAGVIAAVASLPAVSTPTSNAATVNPSTIAAVASVPAGVVSTGTGATVHPSTIVTRGAVRGVTVGTMPGVVYTRLGDQLLTTGLRGVIRLGGVAVAFG